MSELRRSSTSLLRRPVFADPLVQWQADLVYPVCWAVLLAVVASAFISVFSVGGSILVSGSPILLAIPILVAIALTREGKIRAAAWVLSISAYGLITVAAVWLAPVTDVVHLYTIATFVSGVVLGGEALVPLAAMGVGLAVVLVMAETRGWLPPPSHAVGDVPTLAALVLGVLMAAWVVSRAVGAVRRAREAWRKTNAELQSVLASLEDTVAQRTADLRQVNERLHDEVKVRNLVQADLVSARDEAQAAAEAKARFVANVTHEIRTPLNGILGVSDLLVHEDLPPAVMRHVETIRTSGELMVRLVEDVLDFSRIEADRLELEEIDFDLAKVVDAALAPLRVDARARGLAVEVQIDPEIPSRVRGDPRRLSQVLTNLASNAVKFTFEGSITVEVAALEPASEGSRLRFRVRDTGVGMSPEVVSRVFEPFVQADSSTTRRYGGTGLGLTIAKQLCEHMGGELRVSSEPGSGSVFEFVLPFRTSRSHRSEELESPWRPSDAAVSLHVLVVEDNIINQKVTTAMLERLGHRYALADDGVSALEHLSREPFDVVLMDCQMPGMDGLEACRRLRATEGPNRRVPVVALTAHDSAAQREATAAVGMDLFVAKPVRFERLGALLAKMGRRVLPLVSEQPEGRGEPPLPAPGSGRDDDRSPSAAESDGEDEPFAAESDGEDEPLPTTEFEGEGEPPPAAEFEGEVFPTALDEGPLGELRALEAVRPGVLAKVVRLYLEQTPMRIEAVEAATEPKARADAAHVCKGSSLSVGARAVGKAAAAIESAARAGEPTDALVPSLRRAFDAIRPALEALIEGDPAP